MRSGLPFLGCWISFLNGVLLTGRHIPTGYLQGYYINCVNCIININLSVIVECLVEVVMLTGMPGMKERVNHLSLLLWIFS